jgi:NAD(P)-dependent dehydrogenase (short-subunit alcohol dehydrogenase family)
MDHDDPMAAEPAAAPLVTDEELQQCVAVLSRFHGDDAALAQFQLPRYKPLRKAVMPLIDELRKKLFHGQTADADAHRQEKKRKTKIERARQKALDQQFVNNTKLRAERIARLAQLTQENPLLAQVPDGVASGPSTTPGMLTQDGESRGATAEAEQKGEGDGQTPELHHHRSCYTCKMKFRTLHHFYDRMCPACAALNFQKRVQTANLSDHVAIVTGARVKIGYEIALKLLRAGAIVVATTRFPKDAAYRFAQETDFSQWQDCVHVYGLDFRDLGVIDKFMDHIETTFGRADILINNATQTIRRPVHYYKHLLEAEVAPVPEQFAAAQPLLKGNATLLGLENGSTDGLAGQEAALVRAPTSTAAVPSSVLLSQVAVLPEDKESEDTAELFPQGQVDTNKQQVDLRTTNTWVQKIDAVETMGKNGGGCWDITVSS